MSFPDTTEDVIVLCKEMSQLKTTTTFIDG